MEIASKLKLTIHQSLALWATVTLILLEIAYPPMVVVHWSNSQYEWVRITGTQFSQIRKFTPWVKEPGTRKFFLDREGSDSTYKEVADTPRVLFEVSLVTIIGIGLVFALRRTAQ